MERRNIYAGCKHGKRADLGDWKFRSSWEANYARYLNFLIKQNYILRWEYETVTFWFDHIKKGCRFYTPDFKVWNLDGESFYFVEVKGYMDQKSNTKLKRFKKFYPDIKIELVGPKEYKQIEQYSRMIDNWETHKKENK